MMRMGESDQHGRPRRRRGIALPVAHLMGLAPLDVWARILARSGGVHPRYWLRLGFILFTSFVGTVCSVHDRVLIWAHWRLWRWRIEAHRPEVVVILGYYRSGTTHLHNLMSCDTRFVTPRWYQCLAGQGFWLGWSVMRFLLVPFLGNTRPQDAVGFGPEWPAEDDFALCSWGGCSSIPGRLIFPSRWDHWHRWHTLEGLDARQLERWRTRTKLFVWKITRGPKKRTRPVLLKSPSHTARVAQLDRLFDGRVRFVHLVREPTPVIDSNVRLHHALRGHLLEDEPDAQRVRDRVVEEYARTEAKCARELEQIGSDRFVRVRYRDLRADGIGTLGRVYGALGLDWDELTRGDAQRYLDSLGDYRAHREEVELGTVSQREREISAEMVARYGLDAPAVPDAPAVTPASGSGDRPTLRARPVRGMLAAAGIMMLCWLLWLGLVWGQHTIDQDLRPRMVLLVWPLGAVIGLGTRWVSGRGTRALGLWCAALTVVMAITVLFPISVINWNWAANDGTRAWLYHNAKSAYEGLASTTGVVLLTLGAMTAYRHASADGPRAPGT